jgi:hypothetical protein
MAQWGNTDDAANSVYWANTTLNVDENQTELFANTTMSASIANIAVGVFGVATDEMEGDSSIATVTVATSGNGYSVIPTIAFGDSGSGTGATATATAKLVFIEVGTALDADAGTGYANGDVIKLDGGTSTATANATVTTGASNTSVVSLTIVNAGSYSALPTLTGGATTAETGTGSGLLVNSSFGLNDVTVTDGGSNYTSPTVTVANTGGTVGTVATATATKSSTEADAVTHAGWVLRTEGSGGRAGRVHYETLVAMSSISNDSDKDDTQLPE